MSPTRRITAGKRAVRLLNKTLQPGAEWDERELLVLAKIESAEDRAAALRVLFEAEVAKPAPSTRRITEVAAELRQTELMAARLAAELVPDPSAVAPPKAAGQPTRRDPRSHRRVPVLPAKGA